MLSYRKRRLSGVAYRQHSGGGHAISSTVHMKFQADFDKGYEEALKRAQDMEKEGWIMTSPITVMQNKASEKMGNLKREGYETEFVPAAEWQGEKMGIILFREKPKSAATAAAPPKTQGATAVSMGPSVSQADAEAKFSKAFPDATEVSGAGAIMDSSQTVALVDFGKATADNLAGLAKKHEADPVVVSLLADKLKKATKKCIRFQSGLQYITIQTKYLKAGLKVLGDQADVIMGTVDEPLFLRDANHRMMVIAPMETEPEDIEDYSSL